MSSQYNEAYFSLGSFIRSVWRFKLIILSFAICGTALALLSSKLMVTTYQADVILGSPIKNISSGFNLSGVPDVSSILGGNSLSSNEKQIQALMSGNSFARDFMRDSGLKFVVNSDLYDGEAWHGDSSEDWASIRAFKDIFSTRYDYDLGHLIISARWTDAQKAADWANEVAEYSNDRLQEIKLESLQSTIDLVKYRMDSKTLSLEIKSALSERLAQLLIDQMVTESESNFGVTIFDRAVAPIKRAWPNLRLLAVLGFLAGLFVGLVFVLTRRH